VKHSKIKILKLNQISMQQKLIKKLKEFKNFLPLDKVMKKSIKDFLDVKYNYNSNAIE